MEDKLKRLSISLDNEISKEKVFTKKDEHQIRSQIKQLSNTRIQRRKPISFIPKLLTAALFSGIIFSSYLYFDKELMSKPNVQIKTETPVSPVYTQQVSGSGTAEYVGEKQLTITFTIKNESKEIIKKPLKYRIAFLSEKLIAAAGFESIMIEPEDFQLIGKEESETITKAIVLKDDVAEEDLIRAIQVETINGTSTLHSFVINHIEYGIDEEKNPDSNPVDEEKEDKVKESVMEEKEEPVPPQAEKVTAEEAKQIATKNIEDIKRTFLESGEKHNWSVENPASYKVAGPEFNPYVTQHFAQNVLRDLLPEYYCQCDYNFLPDVHPEVRFNVISLDENIIEVSGLEPTGEINSGNQWRFKLVRKDNQWKMDEWKRSSLEGVNLKLTKEEAGKLLTTDTQAVTFLEEIQLNGTAAYVFNVKGEGFEFIVTIRSSDTTLIYDHEALKK